jgi:hypothetical protein
MLTTQQHSEMWNTVVTLFNALSALERTVADSDVDEAMRNAIRNVSSELDFMREMLARVYVSDDQGAICYQGRDVLALKAAQAA